MRLEFERHGNITGNTERGERVCADYTDMDNNNTNNNNNHVLDLQLWFDREMKP